MTEYVNKDYYNSIKGNCAYIDLNADNIRRVMDRLSAEGIMFSAAYGGYRNTVTVSKADAQRAYVIAAEYKAPAQNKQRIIGNIEYSKIRDRNFINTDPETALKVANLLSGDTSIRFSGRILENSATITVSGRKNADMVNRMIDNIRNADIIAELYSAGYERLADTNGFVNIRSSFTGEVVGFRSMDMVRDMFHDQSNEFFHPSAYRVDTAAETAQPYYISEVKKETAEERNVHTDTNGSAPTFESKDLAEEYASDNGIDLSDFEEITSEEKVVSENVLVEHIETSDKSLADQLSARISAEYDAYISALKNENPEVIISAAYEINTKDNIRTYAENEELDLSEQQMKALLESDNILDEVYREWNKNEYANSYDDVITALRDRADRMLVSMERREKENVPVEHLENSQNADVPPEHLENSPTADVPVEHLENLPIVDVPVEHSENSSTADVPPEHLDNTPTAEDKQETVSSPIYVYKKSLAEAREQGELEEYSASRNENRNCAKMIDAFLSKYYNDNILDTQSALYDLRERFSLERIALVVALNIADKDWDGRILRENKVWAKDFLAEYTEDFMRRKGECYLTTHPGLLNLFVDNVREQMEKSREVMPEKDEIYDYFDLKNNAVTFSVVSIDGGDRFVVPEYLDRYDVHALEQYQEYISETQEERVSVSIEYCMLGDVGIEADGASSQEADFIEEHLDEIFSHELFNSLEYNEYTLMTPDEMLESKQEEVQLNKAKEYIQNYLESEFLSERADFDDPEHISAGYTELGENNEYPFQMEIDLVDFRINYVFNDELVKSEKYDSLEEMNELALSELNFDEFVSVGTDFVTDFEYRKNHLVVPDLGIDVDMREIDRIEIQTSDDKLIFYYSQNSNDIERAWESDDRSDSSADIDEVKSDILNLMSAGYNAVVYENESEKAAPVNPFESLDYDVNKAFSDFISSMDFTVVKVGEMFALRDDADLGDIHSDTFDNAADMAGRLDIYINDYYIEDIAGQMKAAGLEDIIPLDEMTSLESIYNAIKDNSGNEKVKTFFDRNISDMTALDLCINKIDEVDLNIAFENARTETPVIPTGMTAIDDIDNVILMWERGVDIFYNNEPVPAHKEGDSVYEIFSETDGIYTAKKEDAEVFDIADNIASDVWDMNEIFNSVPNEVGQPYYLSLSKSYDEWEDYDVGLNEYENTLNALYEGNYSAVVTYIENVRDSEDVSGELCEQAGKLLDDVEHLKEISGISEKDNKAIDQLAGRFTESHEGKFRVEEYFENNHPTTEELAEFIKDLLENQRQGFGLKDYAYDQNGVTFTDLTKYSWQQVAQAAVKAMENGTYITSDERAEKANVPKYAIYQIKKGEDYHNARFTGWDEMKRFNIPFDKNNYDAVYSGNVSDVSKSHSNGVVLEEIFKKFNTDHPEDFKGHSLSVSDVITLEDKSGKSAFFVDSYGMTDVADLFFDMEKQKIDLSKLSEITLTEEYDRRKDQPDDLLHIKNTVTFSNLNSSYLISRYKEFTYEYDDMPDLDEDDTFTTKQGMLDEVREFFEDTRNDSTKSISVTDMNGNTNVLEGMFFEFEATEDRLAFMLPGVGHAEMFERDDDSYDYTFYDKDFKAVDSGVYDDVSITIRQAFANVLDDAGFDIAKCEPTDFEEVHGKAEQTEKTAEPHTLAVGDIFRDKRGTEWEVTSLTGALPFYTDDCTIKSDDGRFVIEENISKDKLLNSGDYELVEAEKEAPIKSEKSDYVPKIGDLIDINDELLSISDISGSTVTFTDTATLFGNASRMNLSDFLASDFTVVEEAESEIISNVPVEHLENSQTADVPLEHQTSNGKNFVITDENLGVKTPKARFAANIEAIRTLNAIEAEHRTATPEEQTVLSGYTGW